MMTVAARRSAARGWGFALTVLVAASASLAFLMAAPARGQVRDLYYREEIKDGRIYVFNTPERFHRWEQTGDMGNAITVVGQGVNGETVVAENETALDLYNFKHDRPAYERPTPPAPPTTAAPPAPAATYPQIKIGGLAYISYQNGSTNGVSYSKTTLKRGYLDTQAKILSYLSARGTLDVTQDSTGDWKARFKYLYGKFDLGTTGFLHKNYAEFGLAHMPWLDYEEHINNFRLQDPMFMERNGLFNSADVGLMFGGNFGEDLPDSYKKSVSSAYAGRYGSYQIGIYNGAGYHAAEANTNKVLEGRVSFRPIPDFAPGLQLTYFGVTGKGNTAAEPDWTLNVGMISYESEYVVLTGQYFDGKGNQAGTAVDANGNSVKRSGYSGFVEGKVTPNWSVIARYDVFDPNKDASNDKNKRTIGGVAYKFNKSNMVLLDYENVKYDQPGRKNDDRTQLTLQVSF
jgi:hypothetical protein